jgi:hypothetical protein
MLALHNVSVSATAEDRAFGERILSSAGFPADRAGYNNLATFEDEVRAIRAVQESVLAIAPKNTAIPFDQTREPRDVYEARHGLCFDRSRAIEKLLAALGLEVRHVSVYRLGDEGTLAAFLNPGQASHAVTEVRTSKGWMVVDSNAPWLGLTDGDSPVSVAGMRDVTSDTRWSAPEGAAPNPIFSKPFVFVRGLYSRHGRFYPPFTPLPDVNWLQLAGNFGD